jgi:very-short-patch-repair endonuclease
MANERTRHRIYPRTLANARRLRAETVVAEHKLWQRLRNRQLDGVKFRRQVPIGKYVADFVCQEAKLILELDGPTHDEREEHDEQRTHWLTSHGYRVIRFANEDVHRHTEAVLRTILRECGRAVD